MLTWIYPEYYQYHRVADGMYEATCTVDWILYSLVWHVWAHGDQSVNSDTTQSKSHSTWQSCLETGWTSSAQLNRCWTTCTWISVRFRRHRQCPKPRLNNVDDSVIDFHINDTIYSYILLSAQDLSAWTCLPAAHSAYLRSWSTHGTTSAELTPRPWRHTPVVWRTQRQVRTGLILSIVVLTREALCGI